MRCVIAFDVSRKSSTMAAYNEQGNCEFEGRLIHSKTGFSNLSKIIKDLSEKNNYTLEFVFEATGVYSAALERFLRENNLVYYSLNPLLAHLNTQSLRRNKTDISDAHQLAKNHFKNDYLQTYREDSYYEQMRTMSRRYDEIMKEKIQYKNRLHASLQLSFPDFDTAFINKSKLYYNLVQVFPHPNLILKRSKTVIKNRIKKCTKKNYSLKKLEERAILLIEIAKDSFPAVDETDYSCELVRDYAKKILEMEEEQDEIIQRMTEMSKDRKEYRILRSFPGIKDKLACRIIAELGDLTRFKNNKQLNAYAGIDIVRYQSGNMEYKDRINKRGNSRLRGILYFMIVSMLSAKGKQINHLVDYYYKLKKQPYNKHHKVAVVACMNKFLKVTFHLIQNDLLYDYEKASSQQ